MEQPVIEVQAPLFVPGDRPDRVRKARARGVRTLVVDLEDAVPPARKPAARAEAAAVLAEPAPGVTQLLRVNPASEPDLLTADLDALGPALGHAAAVVLPKVVSADEVRDVDARLSALVGRPVPIVATVETAVGVREAWAIASASPSVRHLLFGVVDLSAELGITATPSGTELLLARQTLVLASAAAGIGAPLDGPHLVIGDTAGLTASTAHARSLGYVGKIAIHPDQLGPIDAAFAPTPEQVDWASRVVEAFDAALARGVGVVRLDDGTFIDVPVAEQARAILRRAAGTRPASPTPTTASEVPA